MVKQDKLATIHYTLIDTVLDFHLERLQWEYNDENFESFALFDANNKKFVVCIKSWGYCPLVPEMFGAIENFLEVGD